MTQPIDRNQNITTEAMRTIQSSVIIKPLYERFQDTLHLGLTTQSPSCFETIRNAFLNFFNWISSFFTSTPANDVKAKIQEIANRDGFVWFYKKEENAQTAFMGNFHPCKIQLWGMEFQCAEAAFQAAKFQNDRPTMQRFQSLDGKAAFLLGRQLTRNWNQGMTQQWRQNHLNVMREVVRAKFDQNADLKELLLATGNAFLVEHIPVKGRDAFWGDDKDGTGQNWLGRVMMETRGNLGGGAVVAKNRAYDQFLTR